jgi:hypothetical protein
MTESPNYRDGDGQLTPAPNFHTCQQFFFGFFWGVALAALFCSEVTLASAIVIANRCKIT